jgi:DedD protein
VRERLTGAIILVALIVLLVPEVLTGPIRSATHTAAVTPSGEGAPLRSYTINLSDEPRPRNAAPGSAAPATPAPPEAAPAAPPPPAAALPETRPAAPERATPADKASAPAHGAPPPGPSAAPAARPPATPASAAPAAGSAETGSGAWVVQLGSFAQHANAERLARAVRVQGFKVSVSQESSGRRLYRVRVGPAQDRAAATALAAQLHAAGHSGAIVPK